METKKLLPEEIQALRADAEKERVTHAEIMKKFKAVTMSPKLQMATLMSSYERGRKDEIKALLKFHTSGNRQYELSSEVMIFIYNHGDELREEKDFMLKNNRLCYEVAKRIFNDKLPPFITTNDGALVYPKFSKDAEVYIVNETLKACMRADKLKDELKFLTDYINYYALYDVAELALMDYLFVTHGRDSVIDALANFVLSYLVQHKNVSKDAQLRIIQSGNQKVIMQYITNSTNITEDAQLRIIQAGDHEVIMHCITHYKPIISAPRVLKALMDRADAEEVTAYYDRWAREG